ncbi:FSR family fosmidomycin resistance protein-like MFS transporter OS=Castellaniella defragrans OX=75697 GN=HNR28_002848 PE=4 SV=1 [Castellaniella defragrans]
MKDTLAQDPVAPLAPAPARTAPAQGVAFRVLGAISATHLINDMMQSVLVAIYPVLQGNFHLSFVQVGFITLAYQFSASLLQPLVGRYTDRRPLPYSLPMGMTSTCCGLLLLSMAGSFPMVLLAAMMVGAGSSVFHPESSRVARMASSGHPGLAQSIFQVGGNLGTSIGPLLAAFLIVPRGQGSVAWVALAALVGICILLGVSRWYAANLTSARGRSSLRKTDNGLDHRQVRGAMSVLLVLLFSKYFYLASLSSYFTFFLIDRFKLDVQQSQYALFVFFAGVATGTLVGGPIGDHIGRKRVILGSILGTAPFSLLLPYANLHWTLILVFCAGFMIASAFPAIIVYAQELMPGKTGTVSGLFYGLAFGLGGIGAAVLGKVADSTSITFVYQLCAFLPLLGLAAFLLPDMRKHTAA